MGIQYLSSVPESESKTHAGYCAYAYEYIQEGIENGTFIGMDYGLTPAAAALTSQGIIEECLQDIVLNGTAAEDAAQKANNKLNAAIEILME